MRADQNIAAILDRIECPHALDERRRRHPHPTRTGGIDVEDKKRVRHGIVSAERRYMPAALLADGLAQIRDDHEVAAALEVIDQVAANILHGLAVVDDDQPGRQAVRPKPVSYTHLTL